MKHVSLTSLVFSFGLSVLWLAMSVFQANAATIVFDGNAYPDVVFTHHASVFDSRTTAAANVTANDVPVGWTTVGDATYYGMQSPFRRIVFKVGTWGTGNGVLSYEYSTPFSLNNIDGFSTLVPYSNPSNDFNIPSADGVTDVEFTPPTDWAKTIVNGQSAYWVKVTTKTKYTVAPKASQIKVSALNVKLNIVKEFVGPFDGKLGVEHDATCSADSSLNHSLWSAGGGIWYIGLQTDGGSCGITPWEAGGLGGSKSTKIAVSNLTTKLQDLTVPTTVIPQSLKVVLKDEMGNIVSGATMKSSFGNLSFLVAGEYYYLDLKTQMAISISRAGYVSEDGVTGNTGLASVKPISATPTVIFFTGSVNQPCTSIVAGSVDNVCAAMRLDTQTVVTGPGGSSVANAKVTYYKDAAYSMVADDVSKDPATDDASSQTDANGKMKTALVSGTYYYKVIADGYKEKTGSVMITSGVLNTVNVSLAFDLKPIDMTVSVDQSTVTLSPTTISSSGLETAKLTVYVKNAAGIGLANQQVSLKLSADDVIISPTGVLTTDANGMASVTIKPFQPGFEFSTEFNVHVAPNTWLATKPVLTVKTSVCPYQVGSLVKLQDDGNPNTQSDSALYYYGKDCKRHGFSNDKVYFSWYSDFKKVTIVSAQMLASMPLGNSVTYRPGFKMVKFTTVNNVYVVAHGGVLRWVTSEAVATNLYGADWNKKIDDISDAFFVNYSFGGDIKNSSDYSRDAELQNAQTIDDNL